MPGWPIEERGLDELDLDIHNVRIPGGQLTDSSIANYLVEEGDLLDLARDILRDGYIDNEIPVVTVESGRCVVLEGNRRVTALKATRDPLLLGKAAPRMQRLLSRYPESDIPTQIRVMFAPSREAAQPLLARLHTRSPKKGWMREQQAVFYHAQLSPTTTVDDLRALYPSEPKILDFIRMGEMRELIRSLHYDDAELEQWVKSSKLKMTSFEYAYERPKIQQALGISFGKDGLLRPRRVSKGLRRGLIYLMKQFKDKKLNTRSPELMAKKDEHDDFVEILRSIVEDGPHGDVDVADPEGNDSEQHARAGGSGGFRGGSTSNSGTDMHSRAVDEGSESTTSTNGAPDPADAASKPVDTTAEDPSGPSSRGSNRRDTRARLDMDGFEYKGSSAGMRRRFEELKQLNVQGFPNAAYDLLRTILECSIKEYFAAQGRQDLLAGSQIGHCVNELAKEFQSNQRMTALVNSVNDLKRKGRMDASQFAATTMSLNASNHEPDLIVAGAQVHEAWDRLKPILIVIVGQ
ncbi:hypothetical protein [Saccharopolyspora sp. 7B]|uniref:hypothetical protein n=1 Tax=Saccharopolyspora sp. 7B TaxID=2877240 RepID=UPI001CD3F63F|nr:hypothetical protein [Saccharopolyspora sp. 7B]MCA1282186.1 hypothetical protein [Saccharopolyspora sp. 7B]